MDITYGEYLNIDELLNLQHLRSADATEDAPEKSEPEHDEMLFIIIHQVYELWFKQILHEVDHLQDLLTQNEVHRAPHTMRRILTILKTLVSQIDVIETMTPLEFLSFRDYLTTSSGFQSYQFRELEFALGHKRRSIMAHFENDAEAHQRLEKRFQASTLWDSFLYCLAQNGCTIPIKILNRDVTEPIQPNETIQDLLIDIYHNRPLEARMCELLVDLDEGLQEWRYRHVKMVERTIGAKMGTGGSPGVKYLQSTLFKPLFPDLWIVRTRL